jgi:hypothetical protein
MYRVMTLKLDRSSNNSPSNCTAKHIKSPEYLEWLSLRHVVCAVKKRRILFKKGVELLFEEFADYRLVPRQYLLECGECVGRNVKSRQFHVGKVAVKELRLERVEKNLCERFVSNAFA